MQFVTGATGMVGSYICCYLLNNGHKVRALKRKNSSTDWFYKIAKACHVDDSTLKNNLEWVEGTIDNIIELQALFEGVDKVYHCAAVVSFREKDREELFETNVNGTANIVNASNKAGVKKLCYISSIAALSRKKDNDEIDEDSEWEESPLNSNYAKSKYYGELEVWRGQEEGLEVIIANPAFILGFGNPERSSASLFRKISNEFWFYTQGVNGYVDIKDVAKAVYLLTESDIKGERFVLSGADLSYKELFFSIADSMNVSRPKIEIKPWMGKTARFLLKTLNKIGISTKLVTPETITNSIMTYKYSSEKVKQSINFEFTPYKDTVKRIAEEFKLYGGNCLK